MAARPCNVEGTIFAGIPEGSSLCRTLKRNAKHKSQLAGKAQKLPQTAGLPQILDPECDPCQLSQRWKVTPTLARKLIVVGSRTPFPVSIISGFRTVMSQDLLRASGRPTADNDRSTHLTCPATGADLRIAIAVTRVTKAILGTEIVRAGLRWGGGSPVDPETGIPTDWNHADEGPR